MNLSKRVINFSLAFIVATILGCSLSPTKVYTVQSVDLAGLTKSLDKPIKVTDKTILIDARPTFEYAVAHLAGAVNVQWVEFADLRGPFPGRLKADLQSEARKLARLGITPKSHVVVVGSGLNGRGEEGRLAWTLLYLGVKNVEVAHVDSLGLYYSNMDVPPKENVPYWEPQLAGSIWAERDEVKDAINLRHNERVHILDVRSKNEYFSKNKALEYEVPDLRAINIEWFEFYRTDGRPNPAIKEQLRAINVQQADRIIVICDNGLRSGAVTYALLAMGYKKAASMAGGYPELLKLPQNRK